MSPFIDELRMALATFAPLLPFLSISSLFTLPSVRDIYRYNFNLPTYDKTAEFGTYERKNCIALLFWDEIWDGFVDGMDCIRPLSDPTWEEVDPHFKDDAFSKIREQGLYLYTTIEWDISKRVATAWMDKSSVERVKTGWKVCLVETDTW